jgi:hypothetical protein
MLARHAAATLLAVALCGAVNAQSPLSPVVVPALTPVPIRIEEEIASNRHKPGHRFRIVVAEAVKVGDAVVIPAGSVGEGEVIHAAKSGAGGKAGELILAARHVRVGDVEVRLRSFALGAVGKDRSEGALATSFVAGPFAMFVKGGAIVVPAETIGMAKTALEFHLPAVVSPPPEEPTDVNKGGEDESKAD